jgi:DNA repair protein RadA/Sms
VALAVASAAKRAALRSADGSRPLACFGELGLTGELRAVAHSDRRLAEAEKFALTPVVEPQHCGTLREALTRALGTAQPRAHAA